MDKLQFMFQVLNTQDGAKTNVICVTSIATPDGRTFAMTPAYLNGAHHAVLLKTSAFAKVKKSISKRGQFRKVWINLTKELRDIYVDDGGNVQFNDVFLEEKCEEQQNVNESTEQSLKCLLEKFLEKSQKPDEINIGKIAKEFTVEKFSGKNSNADQWMTSFEKECERFNIVKDEKKIELLKSFMEKGATDWYSCTLLKLTIEANWEDWKKNFSDTFANKGWSSIRYALQFKYQIGSLLEYALKKEKLLLEVRKSIDSGTLIDLIAIGLPNFVADRIDREKLKKTEDLYNELGKLEHLVHKKNVEIKNNKNYAKREKVDKVACEICKNKGKGTRFHPEAECWFKNKDNGTKHVNSSVLEAELSDSDPKN